MSTVEETVPIERHEDVVVARSRGRDIAKDMGFGMVDQARIPTAISELARNILVHAGHGTIRLRVVEMEDRKAIEVIAEDQGPGIFDVELALTDSFSTTGSLGLGLPGAKRLMDEMEIFSKPGKGTTIVARKWLK